jgi:hypothetical protein
MEITITQNIAIKHTINLITYFNTTNGKRECCPPLPSSGNGVLLRFFTVDMHTLDDCVNLV